MSAAETGRGAVLSLSFTGGGGAGFQNHTGRGPGVARGTGLRFAERVVRGPFHRLMTPSRFLVCLKDNVGRVLGVIVKVSPLR